MGIDQPPSEDAQRRAEHRMRALKGAHIVFNNGRSVFDCTVRNLSPGGALLEVPNMLGIPAHFEIVLGPSEPRRPCSVRWHTDQLMGIQFDDVRPQAA